MRSIAKLLFTFFLAMPVQAEFFDVHIHFNWDQAEHTSASQVVSILKKHQVRYAVLASTPNALGRQVADKYPGILLLFSPYLKPDGKKHWYRDENLIASAEKELASGRYGGIGEIHFMAGRLPRTDNKNFFGLLALAERYNLPVLIHVDASHAKFYTQVCTKFPKVRFLLAHAGGIYQPIHIERIMKRCSNTWVEFSARDPWRYGGLTDKKGRLLKDWRDLLIRYPTRFMVGTDPVWKVTRGQSWDAADDGWDHYGQLLNYHKDWLNDLPAGLREGLQYTNAAKFFQKK